ncbi:MAG TPA: S8 family serine peptidase [Ferruginibacter sp.]|nr:S8 family serine peptidase [Ferruginibacter sp.]
MKKFFYLLFIALTVSTATFAQTTDAKVLPKNWHQLDKATSGYYGISLDKAYAFVKSKKLKSKTVLVAVIDSGVDTTQEDIKPILWVNPKEIPNNGIDDDKDGHIDDIHGWNFIGGKDGRNLKSDSYEAARVYYSLKPRFATIPDDSVMVNSADSIQFVTYKKARDKVEGGIDVETIIYIQAALPVFKKGDSVITKELGKDEYTAKDLEKYYPEDKNAKKTKFALQSISKENNTDDISNKDIIDEMENELAKASAASTAPEPFRKEIVQDDETNINDRDYGNNDIMASTPFHGTHCSGIIGAARDNGKGIDGIADNVRIMMVRAVPDGDEHDKDIANAIRYAVDNGAQIISMSFGKDFSPQKQWVDDAVRYAESKNVLLIHAAGNDAKDIDSTDNFPNPNFIDGKGRATNWITVGASGDPLNGGITASFSNYGKKEVDIFAPGVQIYSTIPGPGGNNYGNASGTSMATPVVAGTAAFLLEYFPTLTAQQLKFILEKSAQNPGVDVKMPGSDETVNMSELCTSGGIVNAYAAAKLAATIKGKKKKK